MRRVMACLGFLLPLACASSHYYPSAQKAGPYQSQVEADAFEGEASANLDMEMALEEAPPAPRTTTISAGASQGSVRKSRSSGTYRQSGSKSKGHFEQTKTTSQQAQAQGELKTPAQKPMVVYQGYLRLRVKRVLDAADEITKVAEEAGGYVESLTARVIVVRVPAGDFEKTLDSFAQFGQVLARKVKALDVTARYTDVSARLAVAQKTRARLLRLLEQTQKAEERLKILKEIKRLTEAIESMESTLATLKNLVDFFTITIELVPVVESGQVVAHRSPFEWIRRLSAHQPSIDDGRDDIRMTLPTGFVLFDEDDIYRAQAADTTVLRAGYVENEPDGDSAFWAAAVQHELDGRDEELREANTAGDVVYRVFRSRDVQPRYYLVGVQAVDDRLYVLEVFYPNQEAFDRHHQSMVQSLATFVVK